MATWWDADGYPHESQLETPESMAAAQEAARQRQQWLATLSPYERVRNSGVGEFTPDGLNFIRANALGDPIWMSAAEGRQLLEENRGERKTRLPEDSWFGKIGDATIGNGQLLVGAGMSAVGGMGLSSALGGGASAGAGAFDAGGLGAAEAMGLNGGYTSPALTASGGGWGVGSGGGSGGTGMWDWLDGLVDDWGNVTGGQFQGGTGNDFFSGFEGMMPPAVPASPSDLSNWGLVETSPGRWELPPMSPGQASILGSLANGIPSALLNGKMLGAGLGALAGALGGAKQAGTTTTIQDLPDWLKPYAITGLSGAAEAYGATPPGVAPVTAAGNQYMMDVIGGDYLDSNPYLDAMYDRAAGKVKAGVNGMFSKFGRYGSGAHQGVMGETLGNLATDIYGGNYARERGFQQSAAGGAPAYGNSIISQPFLRSQNLLSGVNSIKAGSTTAPYFDNKIGNIMAGALGGRALMS